MPPLLYTGYKPFRLTADRYPVVLSEGLSYAANTLVMRVSSTDRDKTCMGVVTSKRSLRQAVQRSRARRLLREAFRLLRPQLKTGFDMVLIARWKIDGVKCDIVQRDLRYLCRKAGLLNKCDPRP